MKLLVLSDLHGSAPAARLALDLSRQRCADYVVLLGDVLYHGPRNPLPLGYDTRSMLQTMPDLTALPCPVIAVRGNCDAEVDLGLLPFAVTESTWIEADGLNIFASHGHHLPELPPCPGVKPGTVLLRGHTHVPRGETIDGLHFWNPGSLSLPKGGDRKSVV